MTTATMIADSISPQGIRISSLHLRYPRFIHSELMTHRVFSRNARSSRAVPVSTLLKETIFVPKFGMNRKGMQSDERASPELQEKWDREWRELAEITRAYVGSWFDQGMHKQWANRPLEWFGWIDVLVTSTEWANFWALRDHSAAQPELQALAVLMKAAFDDSIPDELGHTDWHLPYVLREEKHLDIALKLKLSTARSARLSYKPFDGNPSHEAEIARYESLVVSQPLHASPAEHQATPDHSQQGVRPPYDHIWQNPHLHGNFVGWIQHRKTLANEAVKDR